MVDEKQPLTKEERRQRQKRFERTRRRQRNGDTLPPTVDIGLATSVVEAPAKRRSGRPKRPDITAADAQGLKYFERIAPLVEPLHNVGCERDQAGNRKFHCDALCKLLLLGLFNPLVDSQRGLQQASELEEVQQRLGVERVALGSLSEASCVFDAELLKPLIGQLGQQLQPLGGIRDWRHPQDPASS